MIFYIFQEKHPIQYRVLNGKAAPQKALTPHISISATNIANEMHLTV